MALARRALATDAAADKLAAPGAKAADPKIDAIVESISKLTLLETADLVAQIKARFNIGDVPVFAAGAAAPAAPAAAPAAVCFARRAWGTRASCSSSRSTPAPLQAGGRGPAPRTPSRPRPRRPSSR